MIRMNDRQRAEWMNGTRIQHTTIVSHVEQGFFHCDECAARAVSISHQGAGSAVRVECSAHFLERLAADRATRPSRDELSARVNASVRA